MSATTYDPPFVRSMFRDLTWLAGKRADVAYWNTDMAAAEAWEAREAAANTVLAALRSKESLPRVRELIAASASSSAWQEVHGLFEEAVTGGFPEWPDHEE